MKSEPKKTGQARSALNGPPKQEDFYVNEQGLMVFTETYHLKRGYCCRNGCKHCPYDYKKA